MPRWTWGGHRWLTDGFIVSDGCWNWRAATKAPYPMIRWERQSLAAYRAIYFMTQGEVPAGFCIDHVCANTKCVRPDHLELVTREENLRRGIDPNELKRRRRYCIRGHDYEREGYALPAGGRDCRACRRLSSRQRKEAELGIEAARAR